MNEKRIVAEWLMAPLPGYECKATFFEDGTAEFFDEAARRRENDNGDGTRRLLFGIFSEEDPHLADEVCRHTYCFSVPPKLLSRIIAACAQLKMDENGILESDMPFAVEREIDTELNAVFWRDINPLIHEPLDQS